MQLLDFSNYTFRCSSLGYIATESKGSNPSDSYEEAKEALEKYKTDSSAKVLDAKIKMDGIKNQETKGYETAKIRYQKLESDRKTKIEQLEKELAYTELHKDDVVLSETCKKYLIKIYIFEKTGRRDELKTRAIRKGNDTEKNGIKDLSEIDDDLYIKNTERRRNDFIEGECDIYVEGVKTIDHKASWDIFTFQPKTIEELSLIYELQGQGYMELWDVPEHEVAYTLQNTPAGIIEDEKKSLLYAMGTNNKDSDAYRQACEELMFNSIYDDIPLAERVIKKKVLRDRERMRWLEKRIVVCRLWLNDYAKKEYERVYGKLKNVQPNVESQISKESEPELESAEIKNWYWHDPSESFSLMTESQMLSLGDVGDLDFVCESVTGLEEEAIKVREESIKARIITTSVLPESHSGKNIFDKKLAEIESQAKTTPTTDFTTSPPLPTAAPPPTAALPPAAAPPPVVVQKDLEKEIAEIKAEKPFQSILNKIKLCDSVEKLNLYYREVIKEFQTYPEVKEAFTNHKKSLTEPTPPDPPAAPPKPASPPPAATPPPPAAPPPPPPVVVKDGVEPTMEEIQRMADACKTRQEVKDLFLKYQHIITQVTRAYLNKRGNDIAKS